MDQVQPGLLSGINCFSLMQAAGDHAWMQQYQPAVTNLWRLGYQREEDG